MIRALKVIGKLVGLMLLGLVVLGGIVVVCVGFGPIADGIPDPGGLVTHALLLLASMLFGAWYDRRERD